MDINSILSKLDPNTSIVTTSVCSKHTLPHQLKLFQKTKFKKTTKKKQKTDTSVRTHTVPTYLSITP